MMEWMLAALLLAQTSTADLAPDCANAVTQTDMTRCAVQDWQQADAELNVQWEQTAAHMRQRDAMYDHSHDNRPGFFDQLLASQRAWLTFRDAHCATEGYVARGGTLEPMLVAQCNAELTRQRTRQLRLIEEWPE
jgi:uncharacterized protein YecT (DUF1311 family)